MSNKNSEICMTEKQFVDICGSTEKKYIPIVLPVIIPNSKCSKTEINTLEPITIEDNSTDNIDTITGGNDGEGDGTTLNTTDTTVETPETTSETTKEGINFSDIFDNIKKFFKNLIVFDKDEPKRWFFSWVGLSGVGVFWAFLCGIFNSIKNFLKNQNLRNANVWFTIGISLLLGPIGEIIYRAFYLQKYALENLWQFSDILEYKCPDNCVYVSKEEFNAAGISEKNGFAASFNATETKRLVPNINPYLFKPWTYILSILPIIGPMLVRKYLLTNESIKEKIISDHTHNAGNVETTEKITVIPPEPEINTETSVETETETTTE